MPRYWVIAPFHYDQPERFRRVWEYDLAHNVISIGWREFPNVSTFSKDDLKKIFATTYPNASQSNQTRVVNTFRSFYHEIDVGDVIIARAGRNILAGVGVVTRRAFYSEKMNETAAGDEWAYSNHLGVAWARAPRNKNFHRNVFAIHTLYEINLSKFTKLVGLDPLQFPPPSIPPDGLYPGDYSNERTYVEGAVRQVLVNAYERDSAAREACIRANGCRCSVCGMSFEERYGPTGRGFIHVHHRVPISARGGTYTLKPKTDLAPACPNCHAMLHTQDPPLTIIELQDIIRRFSSGQS